MMPFDLRCVAICAFSAICFFAAPVFSQEEEPAEDGEAEGIAGFWEVETSSGRFVARLDRISSVSEHTYVIDGSVQVTECTVDTVGSVTARFYYIEPYNPETGIAAVSNATNRVREVAGRLQGRSELDAGATLVTKHYPDTTHARTSEYRLRSKASIRQIYDHVMKVWAMEKGRGDANRLVIRKG